MSGGSIALRVSLATATAFLPLHTASSATAVTESQPLVRPAQPGRVTASKEEIAGIVDATPLSDERIAGLLEALEENSYESDVAEHVSRLWAEDWDSPEDSVYDTW